MSLAGNLAPLTDTELRRMVHEGDLSLKEYNDVIFARYSALRVRVQELEAALETAYSVIRADHAGKAAIGGSPCICVFCAGGAPDG